MSGHPSSLSAPLALRPLPRPFPIDPFFRSLSGSTAFLRTIAEQPEDDTSRLVFADWLDDAGRPERAEFIRTQCHVARLAAWDPLRSHLLARARGLFEACGRAWVEGLRSVERVTWCQVANFHRGLLEGLGLEASTFLQTHRALFDSIDLRRLKLIGCTGAALRELEGVPGLERLVALNLDDTGLNLQDVEALANCAGLGNLTELSLNSCWIGDAGARDLARSPLFASLRVLRLALNGIRAAGAEELARSPYLTSLRALDLSGNWIRDTGAAALARCASLARLASLTLTDTRLQPLGAAMLASSPHLNHLAVLDLSGNDIGPEGARAIAGSRQLRSLVALNLSDARIRNEGARALVRSPHFNLLAALDLTLNGLNERTVCEVRARWPFALV